MIYVFDLGNVLVRWDRRLLYEQLIDDPAELEDFLDNVLTLEENAVLDAGTRLADMTADLARRHPTHRSLIEAFRDRWIETIGGVIDDSVTLLGELKEAGATCYALSNWGVDTFAQVVDRFAWLSLFDGRVISGEEGVVKPDPAIFHLMCERFGFSPAEALFIDDSKDNIAAAEALGFATVHFTTASALRSELERRGLHPAR